MPPRKDPLKESFKRIQALRDAGRSDVNVQTLRQILRKQNGMVVARAAGLIAEWNESSLNPELVECFYRLNEDGPTDDPQCWGKTAIIKSLSDLAWQETNIYQLGCKTLQLEPVRGGKEDTAVALRVASLNALMQCATVDTSLLMALLADLLADESKRVRQEAASLCAYAPPAMATPLLRLKIHLGDTETRVLGTCFDTLLILMPSSDSIELVYSFTHSTGALQAEALASLASSQLPDAVLLATTSFTHLVDSQLRRILLSSFGISPTEEAQSFLLEQLVEPLPEASWALQALEAKFHDDALYEKVKRIVSEHGDPTLRSML